MKIFKRIVLLVIAFLLCETSFAQPRRSPAQLRTDLTKVVGAERAGRLQTVMQLDNLVLMSDTAAGYAIVNRNPAFPAVLAFGDMGVTEKDVCPELEFFMEMYDAAMREAEARGVSAFADKYVTENISPLVKTTWAQDDPYNKACPMYDGGSTRCLVGCVATAVAQVFKFHERPKKMHGKKIYSYVNDAGHRVTHSYNFANANFDWGNMPNALKTNGFWGIGNTTEAQNNAVADLSYACGVMSHMKYGTSGSSSYSYLAEAGINDICDDVSALYTQFETLIVMDELREGRPVIYSAAGAGNLGAHCFVIDGARSDGYLHCNMGWGGSRDNYFLPTDMCGYSYYQEIVTVRPEDEARTYEPLEELRGRCVNTPDQQTADFQPEKWYVLWNAGKSGSPCTNGLGSVIYNTSTIPAGEGAEYCANQLVRFIPDGNGDYYIQTGLGDYFNTFFNGGSYGTSAQKIQKFSIKEIAEGYFCIKSGRIVLDTNGISSDVVGNGSTEPTDIYSNASWMLFPVELSRNPAEGVPPMEKSKTYMLKNTGYSQGYLVTMGASDAHPTLRGVTTDHKNGLSEGAAYHDAVDTDALGTYWQIYQEGGRYYLKNCVTQKFLTNEGNGTPYVFVESPTPINLTMAADGTFRFNAGTDANSYLCAATHLPNPAAFWTVDDAGSEWMIEEVELPRAGLGRMAEEIERLPAGNSSRAVIQYLLNMILNKE